MYYKYRFNQIYKKEGLASDKGIKYSYGEFDKNNSVEEIANKLEESAIKTSDELTGKKLIS